MVKFTDTETKRSEGVAESDSQNKFEKLTNTTEYFLYAN